MASLEMNFCRRCGAAFKGHDGHVYTCGRGHVIYLNASPAVALFLFNSHNELLVLERAFDPGKGRANVPGGFCDGSEALELAVAREVQEEVGITPDKYDKPQFILSDIDDYTYGGETAQVLSVIFSARLVTDDVTVKADDDAASAGFVPFANFDTDTLFFPSIRRACEVLKQTYDTKELV